MSLGKPLPDYTKDFNSTYNITLDTSGWDRTVIQTVGPMSGRIDILGSNDGGGTAYQEGSANLAINFSNIQATNLATGSKVNSIYGPGLFQVDHGPQYLKLQGVPADASTNTYRINLFNSKIS
jgi:hypothetical protein